jgi:biotin carboxylase
VPTHSDPAGATRRRLAFVFDPGSFATLALFEAADGLCDLLWVADTSRSDVAALRKLLARLGTVVDVAGLTTAEAAAAIGAHQPDGILALADDALTYTAELAELLDLPFHSTATARRLTDKFAQRAALAEHDLVVPRSWIVAGDDPVVGLAAVDAAIRYPAVLKPRRGEGSRDTFPVDSREGLHAVAATALADGLVRDLVVEEFIADGPEGIAGDGFAGYVSVESFVEGGHVTHLAVNGRTPAAYPFRETGFFIPSALAPSLAAAVLEVAGRAAEAVGVTTGCLHTEIKLTPDGPVVIEVNGRIGGGVPELLAATSGTRFLTIAMQLALGVHVEVATPLHFGRIGFLLYVHAPRELEVITSIEGLDELRALEGVDEVVLRRGPGAKVNWREGNHGHVLSVFGTVEDHEALRVVLAAVGSTLRIMGE